MDRYFYSIEEYDGHKEIHLSGNVWFNDTDETGKCFKWLLEYQLANDMSLMELDELCFEDSNWVFDQIFG